MSLGLAPFYRRFELPWARTEETERKFKKLLRILLLIVTIMAILIALLPDDGSSTSFDRSSINETFKKPFDASLLAERLRTLIGSKKELV